MAKNILSGSPSIVLNKDGIDDTQLQKNNLNVSDLIESLRTEGYFALDGMEYALYEAGGNFSALPKKNYMDLQKSLPIVLIQEGKIDKENIQRTKRDTQYFLDILKGQGCENIKKILVMTVDGNGKVYLQKTGEKYQTLQLNWQNPLW